MAIIYNKKTYRGRLTPEERAKIVEEAWNTFSGRVRAFGGKKARMLSWDQVGGRVRDAFTASVGDALRLYDTFATNHENEERDGTH